MTRRWSRLGKAVFVLVAVLIGKELATSLPDDALSGRSFEVAGQVGDQVELRTGTVQVEQVQVADTVLTPSAGYRTPGLWAVVTATLTPEQESKGFAYVAVRSADGDRVWEGRTRGPLDCMSPPPGVSVTCDLLFEVVPEALVGAELLVSTEADQRNDTLAVIDLGITSDAVAAAQAGGDPIETRPYQVGGADQ